MQSAGIKNTGFPDKGDAVESHSRTDRASRHPGSLDGSHPLARVADLCEDRVSRCAGAIAVLPRLEPALALFSGAGRMARLARRARKIDDGHLPRLVEIERLQVIVGDGTIACKPMVVQDADLSMARRRKLVVAAKVQLSQPGDPERDRRRESRLLQSLPLSKVIEIVCGTGKMRTHLQN
jgi:hypothetical protein